jgi:hypothetical protein
MVGELSDPPPPHAASMKDKRTREADEKFLTWLVNEENSTQAPPSAVSF